MRTYKKGALSALLITPGEHLEDWDTLRHPLVRTRIEGHKGASADIGTGPQVKNKGFESSQTIRFFTKQRFERASEQISNIYVCTLI